MTKMGAYLKGVRTFIMPPQQQADATLSQANPASGTKYTVLDTTPNARIIGISVSVTWTVQPTPLEIHVTIDGQTITYTIPNPVSAFKYLCANDVREPESSQPIIDTANYMLMGAFLREGRSIKIEAETTGGTVSSLDARVKYAKW